MNDDINVSMSLHNFHHKIGQQERVLFFELRGRMVSFLRNYFEKKYVVDVGELQKNVSYKWIIVGGTSHQLSKILYQAYRNNSQVIFLLSSGKYSNLEAIVKQLSLIHAGVPVFVVKYKEEHGDFGKIVKKVEEIINGNGELYLVFETQKNKGQEKETSRQKDEVFVKEKSKQRTIITKWVGITIVLFAVFAGVLSSVLAAFYLTIKGVDKVVTDFNNGNLEQANRELTRVSFYYNYGSKATSLLAVPFKPLFASQIGNFEEVLKLIAELIQTIENAVYLSSYTADIGESLFVRNDGVHLSQIEEFQRLTRDLKQRHLTLSEHVKEVKDKQSFILSQPAVKVRFVRGEKLLSDTGEAVDLVAEFSNLLPEMLGLNGAKSYLLLFQNNSELRPTGGFIGSFGVIRFAQGRFTDFNVYDVYTADGQLKGHVEPPVPIRKYLHQENWYLRDSNFDPDFSISAAQAEWFLKREMDLQFDGVFAFDLTSVKYLLEGLGGVYLADYGGDINAENLFLRAQSQVESNFFPGSTQKRDFIGSLARNIFIKLTADGASTAEVVRAVSRGLKEKHVLLNFHNENAQAIVEQASWAGRVGSVFCEENSCTPDYLMLVEANLGVNKANFLVERSGELIMVETGQGFDHRLKIRFANESLENAYPGGAYFAYLRVLLPGGVKMGEIKLDGVAIAKDELNVDEYFDKTMVGFPMEVKPQGTVNVELDYTLFKKSALSDLQLLVQKQPGVNAYPLLIKLSKTENGKDNVAGSSIREMTQVVAGDHLISL